MKTALIVYFSQGGTTATVATAISKGLKDRGYDTDLYSITDDAPPNVAEYDLIGIGSPVYIYRPPFNVTAFVNDLPNLNGRPFFVFMLHGTHPGTAGNILRKHLEHKGGREVGYSLYRGADYFVGYVQRGVLFSPDNPVPDELERARRFGQETAEHASGKEYDQPPEDPLPPAVYTLERMLTIKPLLNYFYSYFYKVDASKCNSCGLCVKLCPQNNVKLDRKERPRWGRNCIFCGYCEMRCPEDAVSTPVDWSAFAPLLRYNIHHSKNDPSIEHVPVIHHKGKTKRI